MSPKKTNAEKIHRIKTEIQKVTTQFKIQVHFSIKTVERLVLTFERVQHICCRHRRSASVVGVRHGVAQHVVQESLEQRTRAVVRQIADSLDAAATSQATDRRFGNARDVVAQHTTHVRKSFGHFFFSHFSLALVCFGVQNIVARHRTRRANCGALMVSASFTTKKCKKRAFMALSQFG